MGFATWPGTTVTVRTVTIPAGGAATLVLPASGSRRAVSICNIGTASLSFGESGVTPGAGWPLAAAGATGDQGGAYTWNSTDGTPSNAIYAASTGGTTVAIMEA